MQDVHLFCGVLEKILGNFSKTYNVVYNFL